MPQRYSGRLELTWTNKDLALLADEDGSYEWVAPTDYRVAEVRLLRDAGAVGRVADERERAGDLAVDRARLCVQMPAHQRIAEPQVDGPALHTDLRAICSGDAPARRSRTAVR